MTSESREWLDSQIRWLLGLYLSGRMDAEELATRIDGAIIAAGQRGRRRPATDPSIEIPDWVNAGDES